LSLRGAEPLFSMLDRKVASRVIFNRLISDRS